MKGKGQKGEFEQELSGACNRIYRNDDQTQLMVAYKWLQNLLV